MRVPRGPKYRTLVSQVKCEDYKGQLFQGVGALFENAMFRQVPSGCLGTLCLGRCHGASQGVGALFENAM
jgi:hypothetical protein